MVPFLAGGVTSSGCWPWWAWASWPAADRGPYYLNPSEEIPSIFSPFHPVLMLEESCFISRSTISGIGTPGRAWRWGFCSRPPWRGNRRAFCPGWFWPAPFVAGDRGMAPSSGFYPLDRFPASSPARIPDPANPKAPFPFTKRSWPRQRAPPVDPSDLGPDHHAVVCLRLF